MQAKIVGDQSMCKGNCSPKIMGDQSMCKGSCSPKFAGDQVGMSSGRVYVITTGDIFLEEFSVITTGDILFTGSAHHHG